MKKKNLYKTLTFILTFMTCFLLCNNIYAKKLGDNGKQKFEESANRDFLMCEYGAGMKGSLSNAIISIYYNRTTKKIYVNYNLSRFEVFGDNAVYYQSNIDNNTHIVTTKDDDSLDKLKYQGICPAEVSYRGDITCPIFTDCRDFLCFSSEVGKCNKEYGGIFVNGVINGPLMSDYSKVIGESWPKIFSVIRDHTPSIETCEDVLANVDYSTKEYDDIVKEAFFKGYPLPSFITGSEAYQKDAEKVMNKIKDKVPACKDEAELKNKNGEITEDEKNALLESYDNALTNASAQYEKLITLEEFIKGTNEILSPALIDILNEIFLGIKIVAPIIVIVLSMVDFAKAIAAEDKDALKKAYKNLAIRFAIVLFIFMLPSLINIITNIMGWDDLPIG